MNANYFIVPVLILFMRTSYWELSLASSMIVLTSIVVLIELIRFIKQSHERHKIFDKGNLPSLGDRNMLTGNFYQVFVRNNLCKVTQTYHKQLGKTFGLFYGPIPWVITMDLDLIHQVFVTDSRKHVNNIDYRPPTIPFIVESTLQLKDDDWRNTRRALNPAFAHKQIKTDNVASDIEQACESMLASLANSRPGESSRTVDAMDSFRAYSVDIIKKRIFNRREPEGAAGNTTEGKQSDGLLETMVANLECLMSPVVQLGVFFTFAQRPLAYLSRITKFGHTSRYIDAIFDQILRSRKQYILEAMERGEGDKLSQEGVMIDALLGLAANEKTKHINIKAQLWFFFMAGFETTSNTLAILFWFLAKHQAVQEKLRQAIVLEGEEAKYLEWCINETLRLFPVATIVGRTLGEDLETQTGQKLFKGTVLVANTYSIQRCQDYWGQDVDDFRPERFDEPLKHKGQFWSFGGGPRGCLGKHLAYMEMKAIVARILLSHRVETCSSTPSEIVWSTQNILHMIVEGPIDLKFIDLSQ